MYIIPARISDAQETIDIITRSGAEIIDPKSVYEFVKFSDWEKIQFMRLDDALMTTVMRMLVHIVPEGKVPTVVFNVPGHGQSHIFANESFALAPVDWPQVETILLRSGIVSGNAADATERSVAARRGLSHDNIDLSASNKLDEAMDDFSLPGDDA